MAYPRKYRDPYTTSIQMERGLHELAARLNIKLSDALAIGFAVMVKSMIAEGSPLIDQAVLREFLELEKKELAGLRAYVRLQEAAQQTLEDVAALKAKEAAADRKVRVWDRATEEYTLIRAMDFDASMYILADGEAL